MKSPRTISRADLLAQLESVSHGLSPRDIIEQSSCFVFYKGEIITYNDEIACRVATNLKLKGAVQAAPFKKILEKMPEDELQLSPEDGKLMVIGKRRKAGINMEHDVLLPFKNVEKPGTFKPLHDDFIDAINLAHESAGKDEQKFWTTCVHLHPKWVEACDNYQVTRFRLKTGVKTSTLVRSAAIKCITTLDVTEFNETPTWIHFRNKQGLVISCRRYMETYPSDGVNKLLKVQGRATSIPKGVAEACERAEIFSAENTDNNQIQVVLSPGKIKVRGEGVSGFYYETKKLKYKGPTMEFLITPKLLIELTRRHNECEVSEKHLKVDGGRFTYVACLSIAGEDHEDEEDPEVDEDREEESEEDGEEDGED